MSAAPQDGGVVREEKKKGNCSLCDPLVEKHRWPLSVFRTKRSLWTLSAGCTRDW